MVDSIEFAKHIISRVRNYNKTVSEPISLGETKLQKLIYICDGYLCACGINFINENARAWNYGPVYPRVHRWLSKYPKFQDVEDERVNDDTLDRIEQAGVEPLVDRVIEVYGGRSAQSLSMWTHKPGGPWEKALEKGCGVMNSVIDKKDMAAYFRGLLGETA